MTAAERIDEINRILGIFNKGCGNTCVPPAPATACEECTDDVLARVQKVAFGLYHGSQVALVEWVEQDGNGSVTATRKAIRDLPDWAQDLYGAAQ